MRYFDVTTIATTLRELAWRADVLELGWRLQILQVHDIQSWARRWMNSHELDSETLFTLYALTQPRCAETSQFLCDLITTPRQADWTQALGLLSTLYLNHMLSEQDFARALYRLGCEEEDAHIQEPGLLSYDDDLVMSSEPEQVSEQLLILAQTYALHVDWFEPNSSS